MTRTGSGARTSLGAASRFTTVGGSATATTVGYGYQGGPTPLPGWCGVKLRSTPRGRRCLPDRAGRVPALLGSCRPRPGCLPPVPSFTIRAFDFDRSIDVRGSTDFVRSDGTVRTSGLVGDLDTIRASVTPPEWAMPRGFTPHGDPGPGADRNPTSALDPSPTVAVDPKSEPSPMVARDRMHTPDPSPGCEPRRFPIERAVSFPAGRRRFVKSIEAPSERSAHREIARFVESTGVRSGRSAHRGLDRHRIGVFGGHPVCEWTISGASPRRCVAIRSSQIPRRRRLMGCSTG